MLVDNANTNKFDNIMKIYNDWFKKSRKLPKDQSLKLPEEPNVEINDYGNDLDVVQTF